MFSWRTVTLCHHYMLMPLAQHPYFSSILTAVLRWILKCRLPVFEIPILTIRRSRYFFIIGIAIPGKAAFILKHGSRINFHLWHHSNKTRMCKKSSSPAMTIPSLCYHESLKGVTLRTGDVKGHISIKPIWCNAFVLKDETNLAQWCKFKSPNLQAMISSLDDFVSY